MLLLTLMEHFSLSATIVTLSTVATKVMEISEDGATIYLGDYDYYLERRRSLKN